MEKKFKTVCGILGVESIAIEDGSARLTESQLDAIERYLGDKETRIVDLEQRLAAKEDSPAATTTSVVDDGTKTKTTSRGDNPASDFIATTMSATNLFNSLP